MENWGLEWAMKLFLPCPHVILLQRPFAEHMTDDASILTNLVSDIFLLFEIVLSMEALFRGAYIWSGTQCCTEAVQFCIAILI